MKGFRYKGIILDFDGVLVESVDVKAFAYGELYKDYGEDVVDKVVKYHLIYGGISRFEKFKYYHNELLKKPLNPEEEVDLCKRYSKIVEQAVIDAPWVAGAKEFLDSYYNKTLFFVASGTPEDELYRIILSRNMSHYFKRIYGAPKKKNEIIRAIMSEFGLRADKLVMIGDSITEYEEAIKAGIDFVARVYQKGSLPDHVVKIKDFNDISTIQKALFYN